MTALASLGMATIANRQDDPLPLCTPSFACIRRAGCTGVNESGLCIECKPECRVGGPISS
jgi:hypothetical protein